MAPLERTLAKEGFSTLNLPYPSTRQPVEALADHVRNLVGEHCGGEEVSFVTHSLGGILLRKLLADPVPWSWGRCLMLAPPNGGSEIVDWLQHRPLLRAFLGPAGRSLGTMGVPATLPPPQAGPEIAIIMGTRSTIPFFRALLDPENDGIVSVERGKLQGIPRFTTVESDHTFIQTHPETLARVRDFLKTGGWYP